MSDQEKKLKTRIKELEATLKEEQQRTAFSNSILESGNLIIWAVDTDGKLISFNQNYFEYFLPSSENQKILFAFFEERLGVSHRKAALT